MASTPIGKKLGEAGRRPLCLCTARSRHGRHRLGLIGYHRRHARHGRYYRVRMAAASEKPQVGGRAGHVKVPGGNRRPVPENSGAQSAFSHVGQAFAAQNQRLFEALAGDTSRPGAGAGSSHPTSLCHHCQEWTRRPARFPEHLSSSRAHQPAGQPAQRCDSRPYSTCKTCTPKAPRHQATAVPIYGGAHRSSATAHPSRTTKLDET